MILGTSELKLVSLFDDLLRDTVNLNQTRIDLLDASIDAIKSFVRQSQWAPAIIGFEPQGSWAHKTIIRPVDGKEFDADLLVMVKPVPGWSAAQYVSSLGQTFADSATYSDKVKTWEYCTTISYVADRKIDITPCVVDRLWSGSIEVCNRAKNAFERSEPEKYTAWLIEKNSYSGSNSFRKVTRLIKYLRDIKRTFSCPSVLLTTMLGDRVFWLDKDSEEFSDTPTALQTIMRRLDDWLQANPNKPVVPNPHLASEDFAASLTQVQYENFRSFISKYRGWIDQAYAAPTRGESIRLWRKVFEDFAKGEEISESASDSSLASIRTSFLSSTADHADSIVDAIKSFGISILPESFFRPPHLQPPSWAASAVVNRRVFVSTTWHSNRDAPGRAIASGEILPRSGGLWFDVKVDGFNDLPPDCRVEWRITNTGVMAFINRQKRGDFYTPMRGNRRWEALSYRGAHFVEAFVISRRDNSLVGQSAPFSVVIE